MKSDAQQSPKPIQQRYDAKDKKQSQVQQQLNKNFSNILPPQVEGNTYGYLFAEIGNLEWLINEGQNYLESGLSSTTENSKGVFQLFCNIKFWGDSTNGVYLKFANGMKKKEQVINKFKYEIKVPEKSFEKYLDDCGSLIINIYDSSQSKVIGVSKVQIPLYLKRAKSLNDDAPMLELRGMFPITFERNPNVKIGEFSLSLISSFTYPFNPKGLQPRQQISLEDSFIQNEQLAEKLSKDDKNKRINDKSFADDRIPTSLLN